VCQFCVEHGDGKKWYLEAANYACDLESDMRRRGFIIDFARDFDGHVARGIRYLEALKHVPAPLRRIAHEAATRRLRRSHFGQPVPKEDAARILDITTSIVRVPCVCRRFHGKGDHAYCLLITTRPIADLSTDPFVVDLAARILPDYGAGPDLSDFELLTKEQTMTMLDDCEAEGLLHSIWTFVTPFIGAMCNCNLSSGCVAMRINQSYGCRVMFKGENVATIDAARCTGCGSCVAHCPFEALAGEDGRASVRSGECYGCGVCRAVCGEDAIRLVDRRLVPETAHSW
jgi:Pyruvate/2-oxoacid:ferredoxin oxidoreductase delta subunit